MSPYPRQRKPEPLRQTEAHHWSRPRGRPHQTIAALAASSPQVTRCPETPLPRHRRYGHLHPSRIRALQHRWWIGPQCSDAHPPKSQTEWRSVERCHRCLRIQSRQASAGPRFPEGWTLLLCGPCQSQLTEHTKHNTSQHIKRWWVLLTFLQQQLGTFYDRTDLTLRLRAMRQCSRMRVDQNGEMLNDPEPRPKPEELLESP